ncbi:unnamed protein product [Absidia cylindrospora]
METPSPTSAYITSQPETNSEHSTSLAINIQHSKNNDKAPMTTSPTTMHPQHDLSPTPIPTAQISPPLSTDTNTKNTLAPPTAVPHRPSQDYVKTIPKAKFYYFAELGSLDHYMLKHIAVLYLNELLKDYFSLEELADLIDDKKNSTLWGKFVTSLKTGGNKKTHTKEGTFGVPLEILVEKNGVDSNLGASPTRIRIPSIIEEIIFAMKQKDVTVKGIFRKNGNIKHLKDMCEEIDKNPNDVNLMNENAIQLAALIKKFLREMPEPLLTFKLHRLFTAIQKLEKDTDRKRAMHLACCLLPKSNRDTMEVLFLFIHWVSTFAHTENDGGNKMDLLNLATMIAPNLLFSKSKEPMKDDSFGIIDAVFLLLKFQEEFATVPEDFAPMLENLTYGEGDMELNVRHILKKCEVVMKMARNQTGRLDQNQGRLPSPPALPRQHSSPAAVPTTSTTGNSSSAPLTQPPSTLTATHFTDPYPISTDSHSIVSPSSPPPADGGLNFSPTMDTTQCNQQDPISSSPPSLPAPPAPHVLLRSQSSSQFDTNDSIRKPSLLV